MIGLSHLQQDSPLSLSEAAAMIGRSCGKKPSASTCSRWVLKGVRGVRLEAVRIGGKFYTTTVAVNEFINQLSRVSQSTGVSVAPSRPPEQQKCCTTESRRAKQHLDKVVGQVGRIVSDE